MIGSIRVLGHGQHHEVGTDRARAQREASALTQMDIQPPTYGGRSGGGIWTLTAWLVWLVHVSKARRLLYT